MLYSLEFTLDHSSSLPLTVPIPAELSRSTNTVTPRDSRSSVDPNIESLNPSKHRSLGSTGNRA